MQMTIYDYAAIGVLIVLMLGRRTAASPSLKIDQAISAKGGGFVQCLCHSYDHARNRVYQAKVAVLHNKAFPSD